MLNAFPSLLAYGLLSSFILRLALGGIYLHAGYLKIFKRREATVGFFAQLNFPSPRFFMWLVGLTELVGSLFLIAGFGTQIVAILFAIISLGGLIIKVRRGDLLAQSVDFFIFALAISMALIFSGAGFLAVDLPL